eukprot:TRINITY_DN50497_c0_g1_i1.p1 TRINITY_DN50497_c0_g1~~TRINITY_DN50497_c0_g1_i1.p1  ORF type:complete len:256 (-),score=70.68 TRINITY_DN50497_c0_g1_i1:147-914(-)
MMATVPRRTVRPPPGFAPLPAGGRASRTKQDELKKKLNLDMGSDTESTEDEYEGDDNLGELPFSQESDDRLRRLAQLLASVDELTAIEREIDALSEKFGFSGQKRECSVPERNQLVVAPAPVPVVEPKKNDDALAAGWYRKESSKYPGKFYYVNETTGETSWKLPKAANQQAPAKPMAAFAPPPGLELPSQFSTTKDYKNKGGVSEAELSTDAGAMTGIETDYDSDWSCAYSAPRKTGALNAAAVAFMPMQARAS